MFVRPHRRLYKDGKMQLDPSEEEERNVLHNDGGVVTVAMLPTVNEVTLLEQQGQMSFDANIAAIELAMDGCVEMLKYVKAGVAPAAPASAN